MTTWTLQSYIYLHPIRKVSKTYDAQPAALRATACFIENSRTLLCSTFSYNVVGLQTSESQPSFGPCTSYIQDESPEKERAQND